MPGHQIATMVLQENGHFLPGEHRDASVIMDSPLNKQERWDSVLQPGRKNLSPCVPLLWKRTEAFYGK